MKSMWIGRVCLIVGLLVFPASSVVQAQKFYPDDPLKADPARHSVHPPCR